MGFKNADTPNRDVLKMIIMFVIHRCVSEAPGTFQQLAPYPVAPSYCVLSYNSHFNSRFELFFSIMPSAEPLPSTC